MKPTPGTNRPGTLQSNRLPSPSAGAMWLLNYSLAATARSLGIIRADYRKRWKSAAI